MLSFLEPIKLRETVSRLQGALFLSISPYLGQQAKKAPIQCNLFHA